MPGTALFVPGGLRSPGTVLFLPGRCRERSGRLILLPLRARSRARWSATPVAPTGSGQNQKPRALATPLLPGRRRSGLVRDLPGTGSKTGTCGVSGRTGSTDFAAASRQIAGQATLLRPSARIKSRERLQHRFCPQEAHVIPCTVLLLPGGRRSALARDLPGTGSKTGLCGVSGTTEALGFAAASRQIVRMRPRHKPRSYRIRPESGTSAIRVSHFASATFSFGGVHPPPSALYRST